MSAATPNFTIFASLPAELRLQIWHLSFHYPRVIEIRTDDYPSNIDYIQNAQGNRVSDIRWVTKCPPPAALSVCRESRREALKVWTLRFELLASGDEVIYINPLLDTIYVNLKWFELVGILLNDIRAFDEAKRGVRSLALGISFFWSNQLWISDPGRFPTADLGSLTLVIEGEREPYWSEWDESCAFVRPTTDQEIRSWEERGMAARDVLHRAMKEKDQLLDFKIVAIRRGAEARALDDEDREHCVVEDR